MGCGYDGNGDGKPNEESTLKKMNFNNGNNYFVGQAFRLAYLCRAKAPASGTGLPYIFFIAVTI
jgi:hypothetical protein